MRAALLDSRDPLDDWPRAILRSAAASPGHEWALLTPDRFLVRTILGAVMATPHNKANQARGSFAAELAHLFSATPPPDMID